LAGDRTLRIDGPLPAQAVPDLSSRQSTITVVSPRFVYRFLPLSLSVLKWRVSSGN